MDFRKFQKFNLTCAKNLPRAIDEILKAAQEKRVYAIGFITVDDFYGFYLSWDYNNHDIEAYYEWEQGLYPDFLYQPLVDVVDACQEIDFTCPSTEKWGFAESLLTILEKNIKHIPDEIFHKNNYKREDILFFATMSDGDYIQEMLDTSVKMFNTLKTIEAYKQIK